MRKASTKKSKRTKYLPVFLNTDPLVVKTMLEKEGKDLVMLKSEAEAEEKLSNKKDKKVLYGFFSLTVLLECLPLFKKRRPPLLWETVSAVRYLANLLPLRYLDADVKTGGLIMFKVYDSKKVLGLFGTKYEFSDREILLNKAGNKQFGNNSILSTLLNEFLVSLPAVVHEAFLVAYLSYVETSDENAFMKFVENNRLVTSSNKTEFKRLRKYTLEDIIPHAPILEKKKSKEWLNIKKHQHDLRDSLRRFRLLKETFGDRQLVNYLDKEGTVVESRERRVA